MSDSSILINENDSKIPQPRNRLGGVFVKLDTVKLHRNDFSYQSICETMSTEELKLYNEYLEQCDKKLENADLTNYTGELPNDSWNNHYNSSKNHFPLKNYIVHAFPMLKTYISGDRESIVLECGCGTGSTLIPLLLNFPLSKATFIGFDISLHALHHFEQNAFASTFISDGKLILFQYDIISKCIPECPEEKKTKTEGNITDLQLRSYMDNNLARLKGLQPDITLLIFVLSSLTDLNAIALCLKRLWAVMKDDGILLFRDYALADHNFFRYITRDQGRISDLCFKKKDGTTQMFFEKEFTIKLFSKFGFDCCDKETVTYHCNKIENRKNGKSMKKIFINGVFKKRLAT